MDKSMMPNADSTYELPQGGIAGLGAVLLRAAERIGTVTAAARQAMMGLTLAFANAERQGSVCVRAIDAVKGLMPDAPEAAEGPEETEMRLAQAFEVLKTGLNDLQALGLAQNFQDFISAAGTRLGKTSDERAPTHPIAPLIVDEAPTFAQTRIYFARLALEELLLARTLARFAAADEAFSVSLSAQPDDALIAEVTVRAHADERQRLAVSTALKRRLMGSRAVPARARRQRWRKFWSVSFGKIQHFALHWRRRRAKPRAACSSRSSRAQTTQPKG